MTKSYPSSESFVTNYHNNLTTQQQPLHLIGSSGSNKAIEQKGQKSLNQQRHTIGGSHHCTNPSFLPPNPASSPWPQSPLLIRPSPESNTVILGIRRVGDDSSIELSRWWLNHHCHHDHSEYNTLPINSGHEPIGQELVVDFETDLFRGSVLFRIKGCQDVVDDQSSKAEESNTAASSPDYYFEGKKRTFQIVVKGHFKQEGIPMSECVTGQLFRRPPGYRPPRLIVKAAVSLMGRLAPQLSVDLYGKNPRFLAPLVSTTQTVIVSTRRNDDDNEKEENRTLLETMVPHDLEEPLSTQSTSVLYDCRHTEQHGNPCRHKGEIVSAATTNNNDQKKLQKKLRKLRKRVFDDAYAKQNKEAIFRTDREYTFEFYQNLLHFDDLSLGLGGKRRYSLTKLLDGQPLKIMAARQPCCNDGVAVGTTTDFLWSFDIWHEKLWPVAVEREQ
jgi:hypothetical protein